MSKKMYYNTDNANQIPIIEVARLVVKDFVDMGNESKGKCNSMNHPGGSDNHYGNLKINIKKNKVSCYACAESWGPIALYAAFTNRDLINDFVECCAELHNYFPQYIYPEKQDSKQYIDFSKNLTNQEYSYLGIPANYKVGSKLYTIRDLEKKFPTEHDNLLIKNSIKKLKLLQVYFDRLKGAYPNHQEQVISKKEEIEEKIFSILNKGIKSLKEFKVSSFDDVLSYEKYIQEVMK